MTFQVTAVPQAPQGPIGSNPKNVATKVADAPVVRDIPTINVYNPDTKGIDDIGWKQAKKTEEPKVVEKKETPPKDVAESKSRHEKWKADQSAKKEQSELERNERQYKKQALAKDFLKEGNITKAADALGISVPELLALTNNAALGIQTKDKELTPAQKKDKEAEDYKAAKEAEIASLSSFKYISIAKEYIRDNIDPIISNTDKYELITLNKENLPNLKMAVYEYLNKIHLEGGKVPSVEAVLDTIEKEYEESAKQSLTQYKNVKKFKSLFDLKKEAKAAAEAVVQEVADETEVEEPTDEYNEEQLGADTATETPDEDDDVENYNASPTYNVHTNGNNVPFGLMTPAQRQEAIRQERIKDEKLSKSKRIQIKRK